MDRDEQPDEEMDGAGRMDRGAEFPCCLWAYHLPGTPTS